MTGYVIVQAVVFAIAAVFTFLTVRNLFVAKRFTDVTKAQNQRGAAYRAQGAAYRAGADAAQATADVAAAEEAVQRAEDRLPRRSRNTRAYFAGKEAS